MLNMRMVLPNTVTSGRKCDVLPTALFSGLGQLTKLDLSGNQPLPSCCCSTEPEIIFELVWSGNLICEIQDAAFNGLDSLRTLDLQYGFIQVCLYLYCLILGTVSNKLRYLICLFVFEALGPQTFSGLTSLTELDLNFNPMRHILKDRSPFSHHLRANF